MTHRFFLGGRDLEMVEIRRLLDRHAADRIEDKGLAWGAAVSAYHSELLAALPRGETPVLIELKDDLPADLFDRGRTVVVDHHGPLAGHRPTSIEQIFALLDLPAEAWTRRLELVAANDRTHVAGMRALGATAGEIAEIRAADRAAQGVTAADEARGAARHRGAAAGRARHDHRDAKPDLERDRRSDAPRARGTRVPKAARRDAGESRGVRRRRGDRGARGRLSGVVVGRRPTGGGLLGHGAAREPGEPDRGIGHQAPLMAGPPSVLQPDEQHHDGIRRTR